MVTGFSIPKELVGPVELTGDGVGRPLPTLSNDAYDTITVDLPVALGNQDQSAES